jgi:sensor histidine kinase YesM
MLPILLFASALLTMGLSSGHSLSWVSLLTDVSLNLVLCIVASRILRWSIHLYPTKVLSIIYATVLALIASVALYITASLLLNYLMLTDDKLYLWYLDRSDYLRLIITWLSLGWVAHSTVLRKQQDDYKRDIALHQNADISLREAELFRLRQQLQPHFLYNSLNSINALVLIDSERAQEMVGRLSDFLRLSVRRESQEQINVLDELAYIEAYLSIESVRFGDRLQVEIEREDTQIEKATLPPFILQPVLENAIKFGLYGNTGAVLIRITIGMHDELLQMTITNPSNREANVPGGTGFGLEGIRRRLQLLFARPDLLEIKKTENTFSTIIRIPQ